MVYKMKGFSGFKNSPMKQGKIGGLKQFMEENDAVLRDKKGKIIDTSKYSDKDWEELDYNINQADKKRFKKAVKIGKKIAKGTGVIGFGSSAWPVADKITKATLKSKKKEAKYGSIGRKI